MLHVYSRYYMPVHYYFVDSCGFRYGYLYEFILLLFYNRIENSERGRLMQLMHSIFICVAITMRCDCACVHVKWQIAAAAACNHQPM